MNTFCGGLVFRGLGGGERTHALEQKLFRLQEELTELHKKRGEVRIERTPFDLTPGNVCYFS